MNAFLMIISLLLIAILTVFVYRYYSLRSKLQEYTRDIQNSSNPVILPDDVKGLEDFSHAVKSFFTRINDQLSTSEAERARLAAVLDQITDGVLIVDPVGRIQFANPASEKILGENLFERSITEALRHHQLIQAWRRGHESGELQTESVEIPARRQFLQIIVIPDRHTSGGSLLLIQDLTRLRRLETVRRDFVSNLSHELRTPLASLKALAETLQDGALHDPPAARHFVDQIQIEVDALSQMVNELLELSKIESGRFSLDVAPVAACDLLHSASQRMQVQAERASLTLHVECTNDLPNVRVDSQRLEQVLVNLIHNAVKFTHPGGEVVLFAEPVDGSVQFAVRDTGVGIPPEEVSRIFERFYRVDKSRTGSGTGLGLSIAKHIVEAHRGKIWAESVERQGSTFYFTIPIV